VRLLALGAIVLTVLIPARSVLVSDAHAAVDAAPEGTVTATETGALAGLGLAALAGVDPYSILITADEAGRQALETISEDTTDERGHWARRRFERDRETEDVRTGPIVIDHQVWSARDVEVARSIFAEQASLNGQFPEATDPRAGSFPSGIGGLGEESAALSACDDCTDNREYHLHHRVVVRTGDVVNVVYLYGLESVVPESLAAWFT